MRQFFQVVGFLTFFAILAGLLFAPVVLSRMTGSITFDAKEGAEIHLSVLPPSEEVSATATRAILIALVGFAGLLVNSFLILRLLFRHQEKQVLMARAINQKKEIGDS